MIASLKGKLVFIGNNQIILEVNGVGYNVFVSKKIMENLPELNQDFFLMTLLDVKENSMSLFGFINEREREIFKLLTTVSGISSRSAHIILSHASFEEIISLITNRNALSGLKIPGIGPRKIELISIALRDKIFKLSGDISDSRFYSGFDKDEFAKEQSRLDALNALMNLGYPRNEAEKIIREVLKNSPNQELTTADLIKKSLEFIA